VVRVHHQPVDTGANLGPAAGGDLHWRPLDRAQVPAWADLLATIEATDQEQELLTADDLAEFFDDPLDDFPRGSLAGYDGDSMVCYASLHPRASARPVHNMRFRGNVHPGYRGRGLGTYLLEWAERAAPPLHRERFGPAPLALVGRCLARDEAAGRLFACHGYKPSRWFHSMECDDIAASPLAAPAGLEIRPFEPEMAADALLVRNESFRDHWDDAGQTPESWQYFLGFNVFRPAYSFVAYAGSEPAGLVISHEYDNYPHDIHIALVGTRRAWRGRGLASALLSRAMGTAGKDGFTSASLSVDADSPTGAVGVYERLGFAVSNTWVQLTKDLPAEA
jgi:mycothiol synthase